LWGISPDYFVFTLTFPPGKFVDFKKLAFAPGLMLDSVTRIWYYLITVKQQKKVKNRYA
tara:strand:+ start:77 stop:253 length:177 start_codon:yes stop_codon:yes gene_type:complete